MTSRNWRCSSVRVIDCTLLVCPSMIGAGLVAQCTPSQPACELPTGLPWYFGLGLAAVWLAVVIGALLLGLRLLRARREERQPRRAAIEESTSSGPDLERW